MAANDFALWIREKLKEWHWPPWLVEEKWPRILDALVGVGILTTTDEGFEMTDLVNDDEAWDVVWSTLEKEGVTGGEGPAS